MCYAGMSLDQTVYLAGLLLVSGAALVCAAPLFWCVLVCSASALLWSSAALGALASLLDLLLPAELLGSGVYIRASRIYPSFLV